jgi:FAD/FMN-containing dehydrogenase
MTLPLDRFAAVIGARNVMTGKDTAPWDQDIAGEFFAPPAAVLRPASTAEVSGILRIATETRTSITPVSGKTGFNGATYAPNGIKLSLDRMNRIRDLRPAARAIVAEAGVVLSKMHEAADEQGLVFPLTFGARGSAMLGGVLSTNAGGSNVLRYGNTRDLCLGLEVVLADGRVLDLMSALHKDNTGYALKHLFIGAEGTLGVITAAVMKLAPRPRAYLTATVALRSLGDALVLLNRLQAESGGAVEAFEYMPREYIEGHLALDRKARPPFADRHDINVMIELGITSSLLAAQRPDGTRPADEMLETVLAEMHEEGALLDAVIATSETQRREMWTRRESAAAIAYLRSCRLDNDIALPLDRIEDFYAAVRPRLGAADPGIDELTVAHLGDGNLHFTLYPTSTDEALHDRLREIVEDVVAELGGSFSAEHGIGLYKLPTMRRRKPAEVLDAMRSVKRALDPLNLMNPGKLVPPAN